MADLTAAHLKDFLVAERSGSVTGAVGLEPYGSSGLLRSLVVSPAIRGHGSGTRLVDALETRARELGITELWLLTTTAADFFARLGYAPAERDRAPEAIKDTAEFKSLCPSSAVCMVKTL